jgi:hypothetical protein
LPTATKSPDDEHLSATLGRAKEHWDDFLDLVRSEHPRAAIEWKRYSTGWRLVVKERRRNLAYLNPGDERFTVSFALSDDAVAAAERSSLPRALVDPLRNSKKYPEGRAVRIDVASARELGRAAMLLAIKVEHG